MSTRHTDDHSSTARGGRNIDVIIVGLGPTGATAANLLGQRGISPPPPEPPETIRLPHVRRWSCPAGSPL